MDSNINKEIFQKQPYDVKENLNKLLKSNIDSESDIVHFKLKILQREFANEIELNMNNLLKFSKTLETDIRQTELSNNLVLSNLPN
jgi:hypothetical protein